MLPHCAQKKPALYARNGNRHNQPYCPQKKRLPITPAKYRQSKSKVFDSPIVLWYELPATGFGNIGATQSSAVAVSAAHQPTMSNGEHKSAILAGCLGTAVPELGVGCPQPLLHSQFQV